MIPKKFSDFLEHFYRAFWWKIKKRPFLAIFWHITHNMYELPIFPSNFPWRDVALDTFTTSHQFSDFSQTNYGSYEFFCEPWKFAISDYRKIVYYFSFRWLGGYTIEMNNLETIFLTAESNKLGLEELYWSLEPRFRKICKKCPNNRLTAASEHSHWWCIDATTTPEYQTAH